MSLEAMKWAIKEAPLEANASQARNRLVLISLADRYNNDTGVAWPSIATIAEDLNMSRNTVQKALTSLEETGLIRRASPHWVAHLKEQYRPTVWTLNLAMRRERKVAKRDNFTDEALSPEVTRGKDVLASRGQDLLISRDQDVLVARDQHVLSQTQRGTQSRNQSEPKTNMLIPDGKSVTPSNSTEVSQPGKDTTQASEKKTPAEKYPTEFLEWYAIYPRKKAKGDALKAYRQALKEIDHDELVEKTRKFARYVEQTQEPAKFVPYPATWLRASQWDDELEPPEALRHPGTVPGGSGTPSARDKSAEQLLREQWAREDAYLNNNTNQQPQSAIFEWPYGAQREIEQ